MRYHRLLAETQGRIASGYVTSTALAGALDIDPTQVRKDLAAILLRGKGRVGYDTDEVIEAIRDALGFSRTHLAVLVGAGHLGEALIAHRGFARYGLSITAAFDNDPEKIGLVIGSCRIRHLRGLRAFVWRHQIRFGILTTPVEASQRAADRMVAAGIDTLWNFAPLRLAVPEGVFVRDEHISVGMSHLAHHLDDPGRSGGRGPGRRKRAGGPRPATMMKKPPPPPHHGFIGPE
jgi:redox-sensing transcriptional repressor